MLHLGGAGPYQIISRLMKPATGAVNSVIGMKLTSRCLLSDSEVAKADTPLGQLLCSYAPKADIEMLRSQFATPIAFAVRIGG